MNRFAGQKQRHRCREQTYGHEGGKVVGGGGGEMNWEIRIDIYTIICIKQITNKNLLYKKINKIQKQKKLAMKNTYVELSAYKNAGLFFKCDCVKLRYNGTISTVTICR